MANIKLALAALSSLFLLVSCITGLPSKTIDSKPKHASYCQYGICLEDGVTTKQDASFYTHNFNLCYQSKDDKIYIYELHDVGAIDLVLIFDESGVLRKHSFARGVYGQ
jgi:hypothetical protein